MTRRTTRTGEQPRAPLERPISLRFKHFGEFSDEVAANVSTGGMFIRRRNPHPVGSVFEFELRLGDEAPLICGKAQVAWVRRRSPGSQAPAGMGVRFVELADEGRRHIARLVAAHETAGGAPFEIAPPPQAAAPPAPPAEEPPERLTPSARAPAGPAASAAAPPPAGRAMSAGARRRPRRLAWILAAVAFLVALIATLWPPSALMRRPAAAGAAVEPPATASSAPAAPERAEPAAKPGPLRLVDNWSRAWSEQRVDAYLEAYSPRFTPPQGLDRAAWERQRRARILAPRWITVELALVELEKLDPELCRVRFVQAYESDSYRDVVRKTLDLERVEGGWKILRETVES